MRLAFTLTAVILALGSWQASPAAAQTWDVQLRYWPTGVRGDYAGTVVLYNTYFWGLSVRRSFAGDRRAVSFNFDRGAMTYPGLGTGQYTQVWNINLHRNFPLPQGLFSVYAGWGSLSYAAPNAPFGALFQQQQGLRVGVDTRVNLASGWFVVGDLGYGPSGSAEFTNTFVPGPATVQAQFLDARLGVGRAFGSWSVEVGHRWLNWTYTPGANTCASSPCEDRWNGWYLGFNLRR